MDFFRTLAQRRILKYYWNGNKPFTLDDLLEKKILHFTFLGKLTPLSMESKRQIRPHNVINGRVQYIGTTDSEEEWISLQPDPFFNGMAVFINCFAVYGLNRYERAELNARLDKIIEDFKNESEESEDA